MLSIDTKQYITQRLGRLLPVYRRNIEMITRPVQSTCRIDRSDLTDRLIDSGFWQSVNIELFLVKGD